MDNSGNSYMGSNYMGNNTGNYMDNSSSYMGTLSMRGTASHSMDMCNCRKSNMWPRWMYRL